jgi:hypothetical protein
MYPYLNKVKMNSCALRNVCKQNKKRWAIQKGKQMIYSRKFSSYSYTNGKQPPNPFTNIIIACSLGFFYVFMKHN